MTCDPSKNIFKWSRLADFITMADSRVGVTWLWNF